MSLDSIGRDGSLRTVAAEATLLTEWEIAASDKRLDEPCAVGFRRR